MAQGRAGEVLEGGCGHRFAIVGLSDDLLGPTWAPHGHRRRTARGLRGQMGQNVKVYQSVQTCVLLSP